MSRRFTKIRYADKEVELAYDTKIDDVFVTSIMKNPADPDPDFIAALKALTPFVPKICAPLVAEAEFTEHATVTGISISYKFEDRPSYIIKAKCPVTGANGPLNIATPLITEPREESGEHEYRAELFAALTRVVEQADGYLDGARAQADLFPEEHTTRRAGGAKDRKPKESDAEREHEITRVLRDIAFVPSKQLADMDDEALEHRIFEAFENVSHDDNGKAWDGFHRHTTAKGRVVWCSVTTDGGIAQFWYDIEPREWRASDVAATALGELLTQRVRLAMLAGQVEDVEQQAALVLAE